MGCGGPARQAVWMSGWADVSAAAQGDGRIYVGNLPSDVREKDLEDLFCWAMPHQRDRAQESARPVPRCALQAPEMLRMQFMEGTATIMASVGFVWSSQTYGGRGGWPRGGGVGLLREDLISEFLFQDFLHRAAGRT